MAQHLGQKYFPSFEAKTNFSTLKKLIWREREKERAEGDIERDSLKKKREKEVEKSL